MFVPVSVSRDHHILQEDGSCYLGGGPLPRPRPAPCPGIGPGPLGPGGRLTGPRAFGFTDARATSFCRLTPLPADPGFVLVGFVSGSGFFSVYS